MNMEDDVISMLDDEVRYEVFLEYLWRLGYVLNEETGKIYEADDID